MMIPLKDYNLSAARTRMCDFITKENGFERQLVFGPHGYDYDDTFQIRMLSYGCSSAIHHLARDVESALTNLPYTDGGTARPVGPTGSWCATLDDIRLELPLVRAMLVLRGHPAFGPFQHIDFRRADQPGMAGHVRRDGVRVPLVDSTPGGPFDAGPIFERLFAEHPQTWNYGEFQSLVFEGACRAFGDEEVESTWLPFQIYPGSRIGEYTSILHYLMLYDLFGALDPAFTRHDALAGEWWLIQPVSPRLDGSAIAERCGLWEAGYLPQSAVDAPGRVVLACYEKAGWDDQHHLRMLDDSKWIAGYQKVLWSKNRAPLSDPAFDLVTEYEDGYLSGVTADSYGPFKHSSELPPWPPRT